MTPLQIEIILHYHSRSDDYRGGDFSAPAVREAIDCFVKWDEVLVPTSDTERREGEHRTYRLTPRGEAYVKHITAQPLPECVWVVRGGTVAFDAVPPAG